MTFNLAVEEPPEKVMTNHQSPTSTSITPMTTTTPVVRKKGYFGFQYIISKSGNHVLMDDFMQLGWGDGTLFMGVDKVLVFLIHEPHLPFVQICHSIEIYFTDDINT